MNHEYEQNRASSPAVATIATTHNDTVEPGQSSRSALLHKREHPIASGLVQRKAHDAPSPGTHTPTEGPDKATALERLQHWSPDPASAPVRRAAACADAGESATNDVIRQTAEAGVAGGGSALPHLDAIQQSFGHHDVSEVRGHVGGPATDAATKIGASAYATGDDVAFAAPPDLHTAAHEAAHVVQQRGGVRLAGGIGRSGDAYERHANAVADQVVRGESAEALLDKMAHRGDTGGRAVQRFDSFEHCRMGNTAATDASGHADRVELAPGYTLTNGEMVAMAGDFFDSIDEMRRLAARRGPGAGTREELEYVRLVKIPHPEAASSPAEFSQATRNAVDARFYRLAANNVAHFPNPQTGDTSRPIAGRAAAAPRPEGESIPGIRVRVPLPPHSAIEAYRYNHGRALGEACEAGHRAREAAHGAGLASAMATEAFGAHFLTDSFSAGHLRTARQSIKSYWDPRVPMFFYNFKGFMAEQIATRIGAGIRVGSLQLRADVAYDPPMGSGALATITERLDAIGPLKFGDLVSGAIHDYDNLHGVQATSGASRVTLYGDDMAGRGAEERLATQAVRLGRTDVQRAFEMGRGGTEPQTAVESLLGEDGLYPPERMIPTALPDAQQDEQQHQIRWNYPDWRSLLADRQFADAAQLFANEKAQTMTEIAKGLSDESQQRAVVDGVVTPLRANAIAVLTEIINWSPTITDSAAGHNTDDNSMTYIEQAQRTPGGMRSLTYTQRERLMAHILDGATLDDEETALMEILRTAGAADQRRLINHFGWTSLYDKIDDASGEDFATAFPRASFGP